VREFSSFSAEVAAILFVSAASVVRKSGPRELLAEIELGTTADLSLQYVAAALPVDGGGLNAVPPALMGRAQE